MPYVQSRFYRAPEVMLGHNYSMDVDMWSVGCMVVEMLFGKPLYLGQNEKEQLTLINQFQGPYPRVMVDCGSGAHISTLFRAVQDMSGHICYEFVGCPIKHYWKNQNLYHLCMQETFPQPLAIDLVTGEDCRRCFADFVCGCLRLDYSQRWTPEQALTHPFLRFFEDEKVVAQFTEFRPQSRPHVQVTPIRKSSFIAVPPQEIRRRNSVPEALPQLSAMQLGPSRQAPPNSFPRNKSSPDVPTRFPQHHLAAPVQPPPAYRPPRQQRSRRRRGGRRRTLQSFPSYAQMGQQQRRPVVNDPFYHVPPQRRRKKFQPKPPAYDRYQQRGFSYGRKDDLPPVHWDSVLDSHEDSLDHFSRDKLLYREAYNPTETRC